MWVKRVLLICGCGLWAATVVFAGAGPVAVSPGDAARLVLVADGCPTFSWGRVDGALHYELVIYRLGENGEEAERLFTRRVPGAALSWTPSLERCLERGGRYAWTARAVGEESASEWSAPSLFRVAPGPSPVELEEALRVVRRYLEVRRAAEEAEVEAFAEVEAPVQPDEARPAPEPAAVGTTQMTVDGGIVATSITADGSTLTDLDPASLSAGTAAIDISGTAATATDLVGGACVSEAELDFDPATQTEMNSHAGAADAHREHASLEESAEIDADIAAHAGLANAHHAPPTSLPPSGPAGGDLSGSYPGPQIAANAVGTSEVVDNSLTADDLGYNSVGVSEIAPNAVYSSEIGAQAVGPSEMSGRFCLVRNGGNPCPSGYSSHYIRWDTEDISNEDICGTPAASCSGSTIAIYFCCKHSL